MVKNNLKYKYLHWFKPSPIKLLCSIHKVFIWRLRQCQDGSDVFRDSPNLKTAARIYKLYLQMVWTDSSETKAQAWFIRYITIKWFVQLPLAMEMVPADSKFNPMFSAIAFPKLSPKKKYMKPNSLRVKRKLRLVHVLLCNCLYDL